MEGGREGERARGEHNERRVGINRQMNEKSERSQNDKYYYYCG